MRRKLGQHFLRDPHIVARILTTANIEKDDVVLEIGPGNGILTASLARQAQYLTTVEYDSELIHALRQQFAAQSHVRIVQGDARQIKYADLFAGVPLLNRRIKIVANLPYYAATPILLAIFQSAAIVDTCTFMFQQEVAERLTAAPTCKAYGTLSVLTQYYSEPRYCFSVPPGAFRPPPKVTSAVIHLRFFDHPRVQVRDPAYFFRLVRAAFQTRRKTLKNSLAKYSPGICSVSQLAYAYKQLGFDERIRAEELSIEDFASLSNFLWNDKNFG